MIYLPDTNAFSVYLAGKDDALKAKLTSVFDRLHLSVVVMGELEYGASKMPDRPELRRRLDLLLELVPVVDFDRTDAAYYGRIRANLATRKPNAALIGQADLMISAQALRLGACIVTHNTREFSRVPGLAVEDWQS